MADIIQKRRDTAANWTAANPILAQGEEAYELDTNKQKRGDGVTAWNDLEYLSSGVGGFPIIDIAGRPFELRKTVNLDDPEKKNTLEAQDVVFGTPAAGQYRMMRYNGGDATDFDNDEVYTIITGI